MDNLFDNYKDYSALIHEINNVIAKYVNLNSEIKCLVMVSNRSESMAVFNTTESEAKNYLTELASSFNSPTATPASDDYYRA